MTSTRFRATTRRVLIAALTTIALTGLTASATAGAAAGDKSRVEDGWNLRECGESSGSCGVFGYTVGDQNDQTWCWRDSSIDHSRWFKVTAWINANGTEKWHTGWITANAVPQQASVPYCDSWAL
jgi:hypothetical protein